MYVMTLLTAQHRLDLDDLLRDRMDWMTNNRIPLSGESSDLTTLLRLPQLNPGTRPAGMWDGQTLVAAFAMQDAAPTTGWTLEERAQSSMTVSLAHTLPGQRLGSVLGRWICDYAARRSNPTWVRCRVRAPELADYLEGCGWSKVREVVSPVHGVSYLFQRPAQQDEGLESLVRGEGELVAC
ncbi:hypothetical protein ACFV2Q_20200 [Streptomyces sp. NPDC059650]|uniref:hypothetical protein n=1 Tax=Streptomyces sp. NPDC059650 TaxID=3346896 RepID=UPI0036B716AD